MNKSIIITHAITLAFGLFLGVYLHDSTVGNGFRKQLAGHEYMSAAFLAQVSNTKKVCSEMDYAYGCELLIADLRSKYPEALSEVTLEGKRRYPAAALEADIKKDMDLMLRQYGVTELPETEVVVNNQEQ